MRTKYFVCIFFASALFYALMNYGGIRASDGEIVFRAGESFASNLTLEVVKDLEDWKGFGVARGNDGKLYPVFGPGQSILSAALIRAAKTIDYDARFKSFHAHLPLSFFQPNGLPIFMAKSRPDDVEPHALRFVVSYLYVAVSALALVVFWLIMYRMIPAPGVALFVAILYGFGTMALPYSGTFLSEPLAILFLLLSFYFLIGQDPHFECAEGSRSKTGLLMAGLCLGASTATHITAVLFFPFFFVYCAYFCRMWSRDWRDSLKPVALFVFGYVVVCLWLGYYNYSRFGSFLETGRTVDLYDSLTLGYGHFVPPWTGLYGLILSPGKGILWFCPAVILGLVSWRSFHRAYPALSYILVAAALLRIVFIACRSDWHGAFCIGPRFLLMLIPFLLIPVGYLLREQLRRKNKTAMWTLVLLLFACVSQQIYFSIGEISSYYHIMKWKTGSLDVDKLYLKCSNSPLFHLLEFRRGPFLLQEIPVSNVSLWIIATALTTVVLAVVCYFSFAAHRESA